MITESPYMEQAFAEAEKARDRDEVPVGAVIVDSARDVVVAAAGNEVEARRDPTAHAEMLVIREACEVLGAAKLVTCDLYVTLEPCPMCAQAIALARIRRLFYGAQDAKMGGVEHGPRIFNSSSCHHTPEVYGGIGETRAEQLLQDFFKGKRG